MNDSPWIRAGVRVAEEIRKWKQEQLEAQMRQELDFLLWEQEIGFSN